MPPASLRSLVEQPVPRIHHLTLQKLEHLRVSRFPNQPPKMELLEKQYAPGSFINHASIRFN